jgi:hypothetical protein
VSADVIFAPRRGRGRRPPIGAVAGVFLLSDPRHSVTCCRAISCSSFLVSSSPPEKRVRSLKLRETGLCHGALEETSHQCLSRYIAPNLTILPGPNPARFRGLILASRPSLGRLFLSSFLRLSVATPPRAIDSNFTQRLRAPHSVQSPLSGPPSAISPLMFTATRAYSGHTHMILITPHLADVNV